MLVRGSILANLSILGVTVLATSLSYANDENPDVDSLAKRLVQRVEALDGIDVSYQLTGEFLFSVPGRPEPGKSGSNGRYRTVCLGRKRRFEKYLEGDYPSSISIFDGQTTAWIQVKGGKSNSRGVSVALRRGLSHEAAIDCQFCLEALMKPLSDEYQAKAYSRQIFPWKLLADSDDSKANAIRFAAKRSSIDGRPCVAIQFWNGVDTFWLDPGRNDALVRRERYEPIEGRVDGRKLFDFRATCSDFRQHGEHWIPYRYVCEHGAPITAKDRAGEIYYRVEIQVEKFSIGEVTDDDFQVNLAKGADVIDADLGHLIVNPASRSAEIGDLLAEINASRRSWWSWLGPVALVLATITVFWWWWWWKRSGANIAK